MNKIIIFFILLCTCLFAKNISNIPINSSSILTPQEKIYLKNLKQLNLCVDPDWMPMDRIKNKNHIGLGADYIKEIEKFLEIKIDLIVTNSWIQTLEYAKDRRCDIIPLVVKTKERSNYLNFTQPYLKLPLVIVTKMNEFFINDIRDIHRPIGIVKGYAFPKELLEKYPNLNVIEVGSVEEGYKRVRNSNLYGFVDTVATAGYLIQKKYFGEMKISAALNYSWQLHMGVRNDMPELIPIFDKALASIKEDKQKEIFNKWIAIKYIEENNYFFMFLSTLAICFIFSTVIYTIVRANKKLNREIKKRKKIENERRRYLKVVDENVLLLNLDTEGRITHASKALCTLSKYKEEELIGKPHHILKHESMNVKVFDNMWNTLKNNQTWKGEVKNIDKEGSIFWVDIVVSPIYDENNKKIGYTSINQDITNKKRLEEISITDELTKLFNKRFFNEVFPKIINAAKRKNDYITFCIFDIDNFKYYNDTYGHLKGDMVLNKVSTYVKSKLSRAEDLCFRLGGEEFGIVIRDHNKTRPEKYINEIREGIEKLNIEHIKNSASSFVTASFGVTSMKAKDIQSIDEIYKKTDENLYKAKAKGKNIVYID
ncbi:hypothetical protein CRV00_10015 [Malaciobacter molluscorum]|uniref:diguanylate cyclase n=1 Tax=Malaciobacter molluscorum TaxID=1032072 RepID=UPI00100B4326|nr:diguanylate cyclase [Malaciobacter molluscorum]RXJ93787.1 hypothetical protein CRV00_10015 [Malaciobacter molluscorum]